MKLLQDTNLVEDAQRAFPLYQYVNTSGKRMSAQHVIIQSAIRLLGRYDVLITCASVRELLVKLGRPVYAENIRFQLSALCRANILREIYRSERNTTGINKLVDPRTYVYTFIKGAIDRCADLYYSDNDYDFALYQMASNMYSARRSTTKVPPEDDQLPLNLVPTADESSGVHVELLAARRMLYDTRKTLAELETLIAKIEQTLLSKGNPT